MPASSSLPLSASRLIVLLGYIFCVAIAVLLFVLAAALAIAWPQIVAEAVAKGLQMKVQDLQPWAIIVMMGAGVALALAAHMLKQLLDMLKTVSLGDPFIAENTVRLRRIGWLMLVLQVLSFLIGAMAMMMPKLVEEVRGFDINFSGILAALLAFVLAEVFEKARQLREDLEGTV